MPIAISNNQEMSRLEKEVLGEGSGGKLIQSSVIEGIGQMTSSDILFFFKFLNNILLPHSK